MPAFESHSNNQALTPTRYDHALSELIAADTRLAQIHERHGPAPFWQRPVGFATLIHIILEQQVSLASAQACLDKLRALGELTPRGVLGYSDQTLREAGLSRQKARYCRILARALLDGELDLVGLSGKDDLEARGALTKLTGIGRWTADIYLLMAERRPDIWPIGDLAIVVALQRLVRLDQRPDPALAEELGEQWRPFRSVAARMLWHAYLSGGD